MELKNNLFLLIIALLLSFNPLSAQDPEPPCEMDCPQDDWEYKVEIDAWISPALCPNCSVAIEYWYREDACGLFKDVQIGQIDLSDCDDCNLSDEQIFQLSVYYILTHNSMLPEEDSCEINWRAINASCWTRIGDTILRCPSTECCWALYEVCTDSYGQASATSLSYSSSSFTCNDPTQPNCFAVCDDYMPKRPDEQNHLLELTFDNVTYPKPNPNTGETEIYFYSHQKGDLTVEIIDILGRKIKTINNVKKSHEIIIPVDMTRVSPGKYFYLVKVNGELISNGSLIVQP